MEDLRCSICDEWDSICDHEPSWGICDHEPSWGHYEASTLVSLAHWKTRNAQAAHDERTPALLPGITLSDPFSGVA